MDEEPLESWMARRDASRRPVGALKVVRLEGSEALRTSSRRNHG
ncbi:DUF6087 family protein [Kitasatospora sp. NBC_00374]